MAHEKLYGVCENKCFVEVLPKDGGIITEVKTWAGSDNITALTSQTLSVSVAKEGYVPLGAVGIKLHGSSDLLINSYKLLENETIEITIRNTANAVKTLQAIIVDVLYVKE